MIRLLLSTCAALLLTVPVAAQDVPQNKSAPAGAAENKATRDQGSYSIGVNVGNSLRNDHVSLNTDKFIEGLNDGLKGGEPKLNDQQRSELIRKLVTLSRELWGAENEEIGQAYLAANKTKKGVVTLPSGLQYRIVKAGNGAMPKATDRVKTHYKGTLIDGTVFDSSYDRNEPAQFPVSGVIKGWTEALQKMQVGAKWELAIPSKLAYGPRGAGGKIGPNSTLLFEIELLEIQE